MDQQQIIRDYERRAAAQGLTIAKLCEEAKLHPTTFSRWKLSDRNPKPVGMTLTSMSAIEAVLAKLERPKPAKAAA